MKKKALALLAVIMLLFSVVFGATACGNSKEVNMAVDIIEEFADDMGISTSKITVLSGDDGTGNKDDGAGEYYCAWMTLDCAGVKVYLFGKYYKKSDKVEYQIITSPGSSFKKDDLDCKAINKKLK